MTALTKPVRRETGTIYRGRPLVIEIHAGYLSLREKGKRHSVTVDYRAVLDLGYKLLARAAAEEKHKAHRQAPRGRAC
jgi:hypothetical protein